MCFVRVHMVWVLCVVEEWVVYFTLHMLCGRCVGCCACGDVGGVLYVWTVMCVGQHCAFS